MAIEIASSFDMKSQLPIDGRYVVDDLTARDAIDSGVRHEGMQVYVKSEKKVYFLQGGITNDDWVEMGSGAGGSGEGSLNYVENGNAEADEAAPFISYDAGASYPVGWGESSPGIGDEVIRDTTNVIRGTASWSTSNTGLGNGYKYDFTIDEADLGAVLSIDILYRYLAPGADGDWAIWVYDIDNSAPVKVYGGVAPTANANGSELLATEDITSVSFSFTATDSLNYRLLIHNCAPSAELNFEVRVGPKASTGGAGSGGINLESSPYAQDGLNGWALFDDGATATGVDFTGGTAAATFTADADSEAILNGEFKGAYKLSYTAADHQGEGASKDFALPKFMKDKGFALVEVTLAPSAAIANGDFILRVYDVTNSAFLTCHGLTDDKIPALAAGKTFKINLLVDLESTTATIRVGIMRAVTTASAVDLRFSAVEVGPGKQLVLPGTKKKEVIDLTGSGGFTGGKIIVSRDGADILISQLEQPTFSSNHSPASAAGLIPSWAIPAVSQFSANFTETLMVRTIVGTDGTFSLNIRDHSGTNSAQTTASIPPLAYTLDEDDGSDIQDVAELGISPAKVFLTSDNSPAIGTSATKVTYNNVILDTHGLVSDGAIYAGNKKRYFSIHGHNRTDAETWSTSGHYVAAYAYVYNSAGSLVSSKMIGSDPKEAAISTRGWIPLSGVVEVPSGGRLELHYQSAVATNLENSSISNHVEIVEIPDLTAIAAIAGQNKYIVKTLNGDVTSDGAISDLAVTGLTIGRVYHVGGQLDFRVNQGGSDASVACTIACGTDSIVAQADIATSAAALPQAVDWTFTAKATSISFTLSSATASSYLDSDKTRITVTELPNSKEVSSF